MYEEIRDLILRRIGKLPSFHVERFVPEEDSTERDTALIRDHVTANINHQMDELFDDADAAEAAAQPHDEMRPFGDLRTQRQFQKHVLERVNTDLSSPKRAFDYYVPSGSTVFSPPYDLTWSEGNGLALPTARFDGKVFTIPKANGFSAAGIGFYVTVNEPVLAAITPQGTYSWNWISFVDLPFARTRGGLGIAVYVDSEPTPTLARQPVLWSASGLTRFTGEKGEGRIADAASPAFGLGAVPLAPRSLSREHGARIAVPRVGLELADLAARKGRPFVGHRTTDYAIRNNRRGTANSAPLVSILLT